MPSTRSCAIRRRPPLLRGQPGRAAGQLRGIPGAIALPLLALAPSVRDTVLAVDRNLSLSFKTFARQLNDSLIQERLIAALLGFFALLAVVLVLIGLHGLIAYGVARRRTEIGVRIALGAERLQVEWLVLRDVMLMTTAGTLLGLLASLAGTRFVESMLYGLALTTR
jgi:ABC-type lipoprotein release transport system permease subunit